MKRNIFYFITAFLVSGLIVGGVIWGLKKTGKIQMNTESVSEVKTIDIIDIDELVRLLIPDKGKTVKREDIFSKLEKWIEWDSLSLHTNVWRGKYTVSSNGETPMILKEKLEPWKWNVHIIGDGPEYDGFFFLGMCSETLDNFDFKNLLKLKRGDYVDEDENKYRFNGKIPVLLSNDKLQSNGRNIYILICVVNPEKKRFIFSSLEKQIKKYYPFLDD